MRRRLVGGLPALAFWGAAATAAELAPTGTLRAAFGVAPARP
jgi:hypothetical protein